MTFSLFWKLAMVALVVGAIFFLAYIYPNIKTPKWRRRIISAKYLRDRQHFDLADQVLEGAIKEFPEAIDVYHVYYQYYSTPDDMKKIYDIFASGYEKRGTYYDPNSYNNNPRSAEYHITSGNTTNLNSSGSPSRHLTPWYLALTVSSNWARKYSRTIYTTFPNPAWTAS